MYINLIIIMLNLMIKKKIFLKYLNYKFNYFLNLIFLGLNLILTFMQSKVLLYFKFYLNLIIKFKANYF